MNTTYDGASILVTKCFFNEHNFNEQIKLTVFINRTNEWWVYLPPFLNSKFKGIQRDVFSILLALGCKTWDYLKRVNNITLISIRSSDTFLNEYKIPELLKMCSGNKFLVCSMMKMIRDINKIIYIRDLCVDVTDVDTMRRLSANAASVKINDSNQKAKRRRESSPQRYHHIDDDNNYNNSTILQQIDHVGNVTSRSYMSGSNNNDNNDNIRSGNELVTNRLSPLVNPMNVVVKPIYHQNNNSSSNNNNYRLHHHHYNHRSKPKPDTNNNNSSTTTIRHHHQRQPIGDSSLSLSPSNPNSEQYDTVVNSNLEDFKNNVDLILSSVASSITTTATLTAASSPATDTIGNSSVQRLVEFKNNNVNLVSGNTNNNCNLVSGNSNNNRIFGNRYVNFGSGSGSGGGMVKSYVDSYLCNSNNAEECNEEARKIYYTTSSSTASVQPVVNLKRSIPIIVATTPVTTVTTSTDVCRDEKKIYFDDYYNTNINNTNLGTNNIGSDSVPRIFIPNEFDFNTLSVLNSENENMFSGGANDSLGSSSSFMQPIFNNASSGSALSKSTFASATVTHASLGVIGTDEAEECEGGGGKDTGNNPLIDDGNTTMGCDVVSKKFTRPPPSYAESVMKRGAIEVEKSSETKGFIGNGGGVMGSSSLGIKSIVGVINCSVDNVIIENFDGSSDEISTTKKRARRGQSAPFTAPFRRFH